MQKSVTLLGATGSIGDSALDLVRQHPDRFRIQCLTAHRNATKLAALAREFNADHVVISDKNCYAELKEALSGTSISISAGEQAIEDCAGDDSDLVIAAIVGAAGLGPVMRAVEAGKTIALANKESLVCAGDLVTSAVQTYGAKLLPVDSEHNAIYQVFDFDRPDTIDSLTLTASGGPFLDRALDTFDHITPQQAVAHPNWSMGAKISVDSATMMNKGLELIEAYHLFPIKKDQLDVIIHPQSVIHSMVTYKDGSVLAQLGSPDMRIPLSYCMDYPYRLTTQAKKLDLAAISQLTFRKADTNRFPCLKLAIEALKEGGAAPAILNAANECAVAAFLAGKITFTQISTIVDGVMQGSDMKAPQSVANLIKIDAEARHRATALIAVSM